MSEHVEPTGGAVPPQLDPAKGGKARAEKLSPEERSEIARRAAEARWDTAAPQATHTGAINLLGREIQCAVLEDGRRVLTQEGFLIAIGRSAKQKGGQSLSSPDGLPPFLAPDNLKPFVTEELKEATVPILFRSPPTGEGRGQTGKRAYGYDANLLQMVCETYVRAKSEGKTTRQQEHVVRTCTLLMCGFARVGITALSPGINWRGAGSGSITSLFESRAKNISRFDRIMGSPQRSDGRHVVQLAYRNRDVLTVLQRRVRQPDYAKTAFLLEYGHSDPAIDRTVLRRKFGVRTVRRLREQRELPSTRRPDHYGQLSAELAWEQGAPKPRFHLHPSSSW